MNKTVPNIYRDCLRTVQHMAGQSAKGRAIAQVVRDEFRRNVDEKDEAEVERMKKTAMTALANYLTLTSISQLKDTSKAPSSSQ